MLQLRTLGGLSLVRDGNLFAGAAGQRGRLAILAVIAAAGDTGVSRDRIHSLFWPDSDTERARGALNQSLFAIRRDLGEPEAILGNTDIRLNAAVLSCDLKDFGDALGSGELERAVALYAGPFLDGIHVRSAEFDRWVESEREKHAGRYRDALRQLADRSRAAGDVGATVRWCQLLTTTEPLSALSALALIKAHVANNDSASALLHARRYEALVREELGAEPDPIITRFAETVRSTTRPVSVLQQQAPDNGSANGAPVVPGVVVPNVEAEGPEAEAAEPVPLEPRTRRLRRASLITAVVAVVAAGYAGWRFLPAAELHGVVVTSASALARVSEPDPMDEIFRARLSSGIADLHLADLALVPDAAVPVTPTKRLALTQKEVAALARGAGARFVVVSSITSDGDSLLLDVALTDAVTKKPLRSIEPQRVHRRDFTAGIDRACSRVMASLAARADPLFESWGHSAALPTTWESLSALRSGIDIWYKSSMQVYGGRRAMPHFLSAAELDTTSATPLVWAAYLSDSAESQGVYARIAGSSRVLGPWDRAMLSFARANDDGDLYSAHAAAHEVMIAAPGSEFRLDLAWSAMIIGRAAEVLNVLSTTGSDSVLLQDNLHYWRVVANAHHFLGGYKQELVIAEAGLRRNPDNRLFMQFKVRALAALHRSGEVEAICKQSLRYRAHDGWELQPCGQAIEELWVHGVPVAAQRLSAYVEKLTTAAPPSGDTVDPLTVSRLRIAIRDYEGARRALVPLTAGDARYHEYLDIAAYIAAARGDRAHVTKYLQQFDARPVSTENRLKGQRSIRHAELAALLGDRDAAVAWLERALREGFMWRHNIHIFQGLDRLRGYPPLVALLQPVEGPEEAAAKLARSVASPP